MFAGDERTLATATPAEMQEMTTYNNIVFHHLSNFYAPSALAAMLAIAIGFGILATDVAYHIPFDIRLARSPGWMQPIKALNRMAYFIMRLGALLYLGLLLLFANVQGFTCHQFFGGLFALWYTAVVCMDFIFIARTVSLWGWRKTVAIPLFTLYLTYSILGAVNVAHWGDAIRLPGTEFCGYISQPPEQQPLRTRLNVYFALALMSDSTILTLTCIRLAGRQAPSSADGSGGGDQTWSFRSIRTAATQTTRKPRLISETLLVQGFVLYGSLVVSKLAFILAYYLSDYRQSWNLMVFAMHITLNTVTGGILIRQTSDVVRKSQNATATLQSSLSISRMGDAGCGSCQVKKVMEQAEADLLARKRAEEEGLSTATPSPDKLDVELGYSFSPTTLEK